jgi:hypothetical protein
VIFAPDLDNLSNTKELTSTALAKNVALVYAQNGSAVVFATGTDPSVSGDDRRVLLVKADDITLPAGDDLQAALQQKGLEELSKCQKIYGFDGEIPQLGSYVYGDPEGYDLGDLVEQRDEDGFGTNMRVTEQIFVSDAQGERSYPTLSEVITINPGSWYSWDSNQVWDDVPDTTYWANA